MLKVAVNVETPEGISVEEVDPPLAETNVGVVVSVRDAPSPSKSVSVTVNPERVTFPLFSMVID